MRNGIASLRKSQYPAKKQPQYIIILAQKLLLTRMILVRLNHGQAGLFQQVNGFTRHYEKVALNRRESGHQNTSSLVYPLKSSK